MLHEPAAADGFNRAIRKNPECRICLHEVMYIRSGSSEIHWCSRMLLFARPAARRNAPAMLSALPAMPEYLAAT